MIKTKVKDKTSGMLVKELDTLISLFVRLMAADANGTVKCISCEESIYWKEADCCHFKDRDNMGTRFYLPNLAPGCQDCNRFNHYEHIAAWEKKLVYAKRKDLEQRSRSLMKWTKPELEDMIIEYGEKVKQLRKLKGI